MKYLSLFSGIGGFELGIQNAYERLYNSSDITREPQAERQLLSEGESAVGESGEVSLNSRESSTLVSCIGFSEIDKYATQIYQKHFPNHKNYGDIKSIDIEGLPDFDFLCGGFPCQSFSIAGKRGGFEDTRGTLFFDIARILKIKQPRLLLLENVKGLLSHDNGFTFKTIISTLTELGYDLQWQVLNSKNFGVPQNRERVFIVGHSRGTSRPEVFPIIGQGNENTTVGKSTETTVARTLTGGGHTGGNHSGMTILQVNNPKHSNDRVYESDGISPTLNTMQGGDRQPKIISLKNRRKEYQISDISNTLTSHFRGMPDGDGRPAVLIREATKKGYAEATVGQAINLAVPNSKTRRGRVFDVAQTLDTGMQQHTLTEEMKIRRLTPVECARLQGFPDNWHEGLSDTQAYKCYGNAVTVNVIQAIIERLYENETTN